MLYQPEIVAPDQITPVDENYKDMLALASADSRVLAEIYFDEEFYYPFSHLHEQIFEAVDGPYRHVAIAAPRGMGKTSIARLIAKSGIIFEKYRFICYISKTATAAEFQTENIKLSLTSSSKIREDFGNIKAREDKMLDDRFSKKAWVANGRTLVLPRGAGQQVRGLNWIRFRPDLFIIDDLEDDEEIENEEQRMKWKRWFYAQVLKAKPPGNQPYKFIYIDTIKHEDSLLVELLDSPQWKSVQLSICDENYKTLAPEFKSQRELDDELAEHRRLHIMDIFARENMSQPISREAAAFKNEYFQYYSEDDEEFIKRVKVGKIETVVIGDPAKTANPQNAQSAYAVWGIDIETNALYMREAGGYYLHPDEFIKMLLDKAQQYRAVVVAAEVTGLNEYVTYPIVNEMVRRSVRAEFIDLHARSGKGEFSGAQGGKKARISTLIPYYRQGLIYHNKIGAGPYEQQLISYPRSKLWDIMDAAAYITELLERGNRYFSPQANPDDPEKIEREYEQLENEPAMEGWQIV
jgi:hypothetical protein